MEKIRKEITLAKQASETLLDLTAKDRKAILLELSDIILANSDKIIKANKKDIELAKTSGKQDSFIERLSLDKAKIDSMASSVEQIANHKDTLFETLEEYNRPSGIKIKKQRMPLGLIAIIYESRPNVTIDAFALCFKSGNAVILKGGKEIGNTNKILVSLIKQILSKFNINRNIVKDIKSAKRESTKIIIEDQQIDCLIPRGGKGLIDFVKNNAKIPVIITGASVVHTYIDKSADLNLAKKVIINAKTRRVSICNALDVVLVHKSVQEKFLKLIASDFAKKGVEIRADKKSYNILKKIKYPKLKKASLEDFDTEFLDHIIAIKTVKDFPEAIKHINKHTLGHSEAIITKSKKQAEEFFKRIDAACLYLNTSTQFGDGGEFGMGGEIGISTQKLHARGPFAYKELTTYKYFIESKGAIRNI